MWTIGVGFCAVDDNICPGGDIGLLVSAALLIGLTTVARSLSA